MTTLLQVPPVRPTLTLAVNVHVDYCAPGCWHCQGVAS